MNQFVRICFNSNTITHLKTKPKYCKYKSNYQILNIELGKIETIVQRITS